MDFVNARKLLMSMTFAREGTQEDGDGDGANLRYHAEGWRAGPRLFHEHGGEAEAGAAAGKPWRGRDRGGFSHRVEGRFRGGEGSGAGDSGEHGGGGGAGL